MTDGERYALWGSDSNRYLTVRDATTGRVRRVAKPWGCGIPDDWIRLQPADAGRALLICPGQSSVIDLRTGALTELPSTVDSPDGQLTEVGWVEIGRRWVKGFGTLVHDHVADQLGLYFNLGSRETRVVKPGTPVDLDQSDLTPAPPCPAIQASLMRMPDLNRGERRFYWQAPGLLLDYRFKLTRSTASDLRLLLHRCDGTTQVLARGRINSPRVTGGLVSWNNGADEADPSSARRRDQLSVYNPKAHAARHWRLPLLTADLDGPIPNTDVGISWHTRHEVFWAAVTEQSCDKASCYPYYRVFAAPLE